MPDSRRCPSSSRDSPPVSWASNSWRSATNGSSHACPCRSTGSKLRGGAIIAFAGTPGATGTFVNLPKGARTTTIDSSTNAVGGGAAGTVVMGECKALHRGCAAMGCRAANHTDCRDGVRLNGDQTARRGVRALAIVARPIEYLGPVQAHPLHLLVDQSGVAFEIALCDRFENALVIGGRFVRAHAAGEEQTPAPGGELWNAFSSCSRLLCAASMTRR